MPIPLKVPGILAVAFGLLTIVSGAMALFGSAERGYDFGDVVPYVLWFNFLAGFVYVLAGFGLLQARRWGAQLAIVLALLTVLVFALFGVHVAGGGAYEMRTVFAMAFRSAFWVVVAWIALRALNRELLR